VIADPDLGARLALVCDVDRGGRIVSDQDRGQPRDRAACLQGAATDSEAFRFSGPTIDREVFARCMEAKGYTLRK